MDPSKHGRAKRSRRREAGVIGLSLGSTAVIVLGCLFASHRLVLVALLATLGNLIGLVLLSPNSAESDEPESRSSAAP